MNIAHFKFQFLVLCTTGLLLSGCAGIYHMDIQQGNLLNESQVKQLQTGMNKRQVQYLLGAPLITDPFHKQRWDYYYSFRKGGASTTRRQQLTLYFQDQTLQKIERHGDAAKTVELPNSNTSDQQTAPGFFQRLWNKIKKAT